MVIKMTNREWMENLPNDKLAEFLTCGLYLKLRNPIVGNIVTVSHIVTSLPQIARQYTQSHIGVAQWLAAPQEFELEE